MKVLYLSGAPRLSTKSTTESLGPRSHILGAIAGFRALGANVETYVAGDRVRDSVHGQGSEARMTGSAARVVLVDVARFGYRLLGRIRARKLATVSTQVAYERYALFQELGSVAQRSGTFWILEVNALLSIESTSDRKTTTLQRFAKWVEKRTLHRPDLLVAVTETLADDITSVHGVPRSRIVVVPNGVDVEESGDVRFERRSQTASPKCIGFLGTLYSWQNVDLLLESMTDGRLRQCHLRVAGGGPELNRLKAYAKTLGVQDRVNFLGPVEPADVPRFLDSIDVGFVGHESSGGMYFSPLKLWEYLGAGVPVVSNKNQLVVDLAADGYPITTYGEMTSGAIASAIGELARSWPQMLELAAEAPELVRRDHSWNARVRTIVDRAEKAMSSPRDRNLRLGLGRITPASARQVVDIIERRPRNFTIANLNLHGLYMRQTNTDFRDYTDSAELVLADGWPLLPLAGIPVTQSGTYRVGSTDWLDELLKRDPNLRVVAVGGSAAVASSMTAHVQSHTTNLVWRHYDGYTFQPSGDNPDLDESLASADLVLVGLGMPVQEEWITSNADKIRGVVANVGGCFDYYAGAQKMAPQKFRNAGLEWAFRLANDPKRLAKRYLIEPFKLLRLVATRKTVPPIQRGQSK